MAKDPSAATPEKGDNLTLAEVLLGEDSYTDKRKFEAQIGRLISLWSEIELILRAIFQGSVTKDILLAANLFYVPEAFRNKVDMVNVAVSHKLKLFQVSKTERFKNPLWKEWVRVRNKALELVDLRNRVAHGTINENTKLEGNYELLRPIGSVKWLDEQVDKNKDQIDIKTLKKWMNKITSLRDELIDCSEAIYKNDPTLLPKAKKPAPKPRKRGGGKSKG